MTTGQGREVCRTSQGCERRCYIYRIGCGDVKNLRRFVEGEDGFEVDHFAVNLVVVAATVGM